MLTKEEREEIKKRFDECSELDLSNMYKCLFGKDVSSGTSWVQDFSEMVDRIFELYVVVSSGTCNNDDVMFAEDLTHKSPVTTRLLAQRIRDVLDDENTHTVKFAYVELNHIADIMESLADNDE